MGTWTIYTAGADVTLLGAVLNGAAMIAAQSAFVWGFAMVAALWRLVSTATAGALGVGSQAGGSMVQGAYGAVMPLVLAMLLTNPGMQCTVQVESSLTGAVTVVDNVPLVIAIIPAGGSLLASDVGDVMKTVFNNVNPSYDFIAANGVGFLDPMKRLLGARSAIQRLSGIDSEVRAVVADCLGSDAGMDYSAINNAVINAGNGGATAATAFDVSGGGTITGIGALLWSAGQNTFGLVPDLTVPTGAILGCYDAAQLVATHIQDALASNEFARVIQPAVNGMDEPQATSGYTIGELSQEYGALRRFRSATGALVAGQMQTDSEMINFLFAELVSNGLNCLRASGSNKSICEASMIQANEVERNNIQAAANEVPMLEYAGSFGHYMLALIIGLGPVIVLFMMFAGLGAAKALKTTTHIVVWPLLVMNVGAELVNAMISMQFSNFLSSLAHGGFLSPAVMATAYKELSLQVGTGSHLMASLPVLMSIIFSLGGTAALVSVASEMKPKGTEVGHNLAPSPSMTEPLVANSGMAKATQGAGWSSIHENGGMVPIAQAQRIGDFAQDASRRQSEVVSKQQTISEMASAARTFDDMNQSGDYSRWGLTQSEGQALRNVYDESLRSSDSASAGSGTTAEQSNSVGASNGGSVSGTAGLTSGLGVDGEIHRKRDASSQDQFQYSTSTATSQQEETARAMSRALSSDTAKNIETAHGHDMSSSFKQAAQTARNYQELTSKTGTLSDSVENSNRATNALTMASREIGAATHAKGAMSSPSYQRFLLDAGNRFETDPSTQRYREQASQEQESRMTDQMNGPAASRAVTLMRAAEMQANDATASPQERARAVNYISGGIAALTQQSFVPTDTREGWTSPVVGETKNTTGMAPGGRVKPGSAGPLPPAAVRMGKNETTFEPIPQIQMGSAQLGAAASVLHPDGEVDRDVTDRKAAAERAGLGAQGINVKERSVAGLFGPDNFTRPTAAPQPAPPRPPAAPAPAPAFNKPTGSFDPQGVPNGD